MHKIALKNGEPRSGCTAKPRVRPHPGTQDAVHHCNAEALHDLLSTKDRCNIMQMRFVFGQPPKDSRCFVSPPGRFCQKATPSKLNHDTTCVEVLYPCGRHSASRNRFHELFHLLIFISFQGGKIMNIRRFLCIGVGTALAVAFAHSSFAQHRHGLTGPKEFFKRVKPGQWIEIEGIPQKDLTILSTKATILTGDFQDDDWEISGKVTTVIPEKNQFRVGTLVINVNKDAEYETATEGKTFKSLKDMEPGMIVELEGTYLKNGKFLANEVEDETDNPKKKKKKNIDKLIKLVGKIKKVNPPRNSIEIMGSTFIIGPQTKIKSATK